MLDDLVDPERGVMTEMETWSIRWETMSGTIFTKAQWFLLMENTWQKEEMRTWHVSACIAGNESINREDGKKEDEENHVSLHSKEFQNDTLMMVLGLEGEENKKGLRKDAAEKYLPAEQHPWWPWLG